jgi:hypothetical protein
MTEVKDAAEVQDNTTKTVTKTVAEVKPEGSTEVKKEETIGEVLADKKPEPRMVPEAALLEYKNSNKELKKDLKELKDLIESGASKKEISTDLKALADEHNVDPEFLSKFAESIKAQNKKDIDDEVSARLKPLEEKDKKAKIDKIFKENYDKALEAMPEYKDIANEAVIKSLSLDPANQNKTWTQIIEEAYGHLITGKRTMESPTARGGRDDNQDVDVARASKDPSYFKEVMADPVKKAKYNAGLAERLKL